MLRIAAAQDGAVPAAKRPRIAQADGGESSAEDGGGGELMVLVFNLGGGTCDASLISLDAGILEVRLYCTVGVDLQRPWSISSS